MATFYLSLDFLLDSVRVKEFGPEMEFARRYPGMNQTGAWGWGWQGIKTKMSRRRVFRKSICHRPPHGRYSKKSKSYEQILVNLSVSWQLLNVEISCLVIWFIHTIMTKSVALSVQSTFHMKMNKFEEMYCKHWVLLLNRAESAESESYWKIEIGLNISK